MNADQPGRRASLLASLPPFLRVKVYQFEGVVRMAERAKDRGDILDGQLANFYTLLYLTMAGTDHGRPDPDRPV